ncbi:helix-turn-helix domain-containing protein [Rheinheimera maricola]|uniref:AraC family transcriptional regulator n=1 Tax=Rheinheimera maricola TaxID=2793282 RepID=A0ABS7X9A1_9GAMM|nr:AraC family transcriptional regulator [Rheinheimera maricola]MBZ9612121.1 AraC family transcriptional regulator [Rheinheimera maricola]
MPTYFANYLLAGSLGLVSIAIPMLMARREVSQAYLMLALFLIFTALANALPMLIQAFPSLELYSLAIVIPSYVFQPICLWFYVKALCSPTLWHIKQNRKLHYVLPILSLLYAVALLCTPSQYLVELMQGTEQPLSQTTELLAMFTFAFMLIWLMQSSIYIYLIIKRLLAYRSELRHLFASNDKREMSWLFFIISAISVAWLLAFCVLLLSFSGEANDALTNTLLLAYFALLWLMSFWGLRQKPGFSERYLQQEDLDAIATLTTMEDTPAKYNRSGLDEARSEKIADKIEQVMKAKSLYLNPDLSLKLLAAEVAEKPNYVSQVLNQKLNSSFFDYVNGYRIEYSKQLISENKLPIIEVAFASGFNAKSSFYKAFKVKTGQTPKQFAAKAPAICRD